MAQYAWGKGWKTAALATDGVIVYFKNVVAGVQGALHAARRQDRRPGDVPAPLGGNDVNNAVSRLNNVEGRRGRHVDRGRVRRALDADLRAAQSLGNNTPMLNSWAGDGTYWLPKSPQVTNYYFVTYASVFGDDPNPAVNKLAKQVHAGTGGFITGSAAIDGVVTAIRRRTARRTARRSPRSWRSSTACRRCRAR